METSTQERLPGTEGKRTGRKDKDGTEALPNYIRIKDAAKELMRSYKKMEAAREAFNDTVKAIAERGNVNTSSLKKLVRDSASGNFADRRRMIDQQSELFEMVGEIAGGGKGAGE